MNVTVFGATGNIGSRVVARLLANDYSVTAFVHGASNLPNNPRLKIVQGDIYNQQDVENALADAEIVVSTLGSWGTKRQDVLTEGMKRIIPGMNKRGVRRIISLTGSGVLLPTDNAKWYDELNPLLLKLIGPKILKDGAQHIELLAKSDLDWTVIRSPVMQNGSTKGYTLQQTPPLLWQTIRHDDVADAIVELVKSGKQTKSAPFIA